LLKGRIESCDDYYGFYTKETAIPYYDSAVSIGEDGSFLFFDKNNVFTNLNYKGCFRKERDYLYPNVIDNNLFLYAEMKGNYSIRDFNNSIWGCTKKS
jgi:hypothetical protein